MVPTATQKCVGEGFLYDVWLIIPSCNAPIERERDHSAQPVAVALPQSFLSRRITGRCRGSQLLGIGSRWRQGVFPGRILRIPVNNLHVARLFCDQTSRHPRAAVEGAGRVLLGDERHQPQILG
jgi:hypothetical protein